MTISYWLYQVIVYIDAISIAHLYNVTPATVVKLCDNMI